MLFPNYDWIDGAWVSAPGVYYSIDEIRYSLSRLGNPDHEETQERIAAFVAFDPTNHTIHAWLSAQAPDRLLLSTKNPWLLDGTQRPPNDPPVRQQQVDTLIADWKRRVFIANRTDVVGDITIARESDGALFDGDEKSQERLVRVVALGNAALLQGIYQVLAALESDPDLTAQELAAGLKTAMDSAFALLQTPWAGADNVARILTHPDASEVLEKAGVAQTEVWFPPEE